MDECKHVLSWGTMSAFDKKLSVLWCTICGHVEQSVAL